MSLREKRDPRKKGWVVKIDRPEELCKTPYDYYSIQEVEKHNKSPHMKRTQRKLTLRIIELIQPNHHAKVLDIGCAVGFSTELLHEFGFDVTGFDVNEQMLEKAKERGIETVLGDMRDIKNFFNKETFDIVVSVSALQWITDQNEVKKVVTGIYTILKKEGWIGIQFYPHSESELNFVFGMFKRIGFEGEVVIDNSNNSRKRVVYLIMKKI